MWNLATGEEVVCWSDWPAESVHFAAAFSWDGRHIVVVAYDNTIHIGDMEKCTVTAGPIGGGVIKLMSAAISSDGKSVVTGSERGEIRVWNTNARQTTSASSDRPIGVIHEANLSPDGTYIASEFNGRINGRSGTLQVGDAETGQITQCSPEGYIDWLNSERHSLNGRRIQRGADDRTILVLDTETDEITLGPLKGHTVWVHTFSFSSDGRYIVSLDIDNIIRVWHSTKEQARSEVGLITSDESDSDQNQSCVFLHNNIHCYY